MNRFIEYDLVGLYLILPINLHPFVYEGNKTRVHCVLLQYNYVFEYFLQ